MFFQGSVFWFVMGIVAVLVAVGFSAFAVNRGWTLTWWKWLLAILWYLLLSMTFFTFGTLIGENEGNAAWRIGLLGLFVCLVSGVGLWRVMGFKPKA